MKHNTHYLKFEIIHSIWKVYMPTRMSGLVKVPRQHRHNFPRLLWFFRYIAISLTLTWLMYQYRVTNRWQPYSTGFSIS